MPKQQQRAADLRGLFIYQDKKHGTVYYDIFSGNGYILTSSDVKTYMLSMAFLPIAVIVFYFASQFGVNLILSIVIGIALYAIMQIIYRTKFLYQLPCVENYGKEKKENIVTNLAKNYSKPRIIALVVLSFLLLVFTIIYLVTNKYTGVALVGLLIVIVITFLLFAVCLAGLLYKLKQKDE